MLRNDYPNDWDFAEKVTEYIATVKNCCEDKDNYVIFNDEQLSHGDKVISGIRCKICNEIIEFRLT